jgi:hypothetical protein
MRGRVHHEIRNVGDRGAPGGNGYINVAAGSDAARHITTEPEWVGNVLDNLECAYRVILTGMMGGVLCDRLVPDVG